MRRLPPMTSLPAFEAAARLGSMSAAAHELGRSHSAISKQVSNLEDWLGTPLFVRENSGLRLTPDGAAFYEASRTALDQVERAVMDLTSRGALGPVVVGISAALAARWLLPRLFDLDTQYPGVTIQLSIGPGRVGDAPFEAVDMVLSWDRLSSSVDDLKRKFHPNAEVAVIDDARIGPVMRDQEALQQAVIVSEGRSSVWPRWAHLSERSLPKLPQRVVPNTPLAIEAALAGLGMTMVERRLVERELESGALLAPFGFLTAPDGFVVVSPPNARREIRSVVQWLVRSAPFVVPAS